MCSLICHARFTGGQRKKARAVEAAEHKTGTSSENSKASRTTQQKMELGAAAGGSVTQAEGRECALGRHRGESADSEHRGGDSCDQNELNDGSKHSEVRPLSQRTTRLKSLILWQVHVPETCHITCLNQNMIFV